MFIKRYIEIQVKNHSYFIFFFCIGLFLNLDLSSKDICDLQASNSSFNPTTASVPLPKANLALTVSQKSTKKLIRPRYYSTELGIKEKLFVGVFTTPDQIEDRTIAINKTVSHLVDKIKYFMSAYNYKTVHNLGNIVGFTDKRELLRPFHVIKYIADGFAQNYDYFFLMKDSLYLNARTLKYIVNKISVSQHVYMGTKITDSTFCSLDAGILMSNSVIVAIMENLDWCIKNSFSDNHSENLGRCVAHSINLDCQEDLQGQTITSFRLRRHGILKNLDQLSENPNFDSSVTVYPVTSTEDIYTLHAYHSRLSASRVASESNSIGEDIRALGPKLPEGHKHISWPVGRRPGVLPTSRFDFAKHIYFNLTHKYFHSDYSNVAALTSAEKLDIKNVLEATISKAQIISEGNLIYRRLINGYRIFDLSRGLDYTFDIGFKDLASGKEIIKRYKVCKPLGNVEILSVPYVTENNRVSLLVTIRETDIKFVSDFTEMYLKAQTGDRRQKTFLMFVLVYETNSPSKGDQDVFKDVKNLAMKTTSKCGHKDSCKVAWLSIRLPEMKKEYIKNENALKIAIIDLGLRKVGTDSLVLVLDTGTVVEPEFLNRVRMNTISGFQIFSPIPFRLFDPSLVEPEIIARKVDVHKSTGRFDTTNFSCLSFYGKDYVTARLKSQNVIPIVRNDRDIKYLLEANISEKWNIFRVFVKYSDVHCMRATDPGIKVKYLEDKNNFTPYASKNQLAKLILKYGPPF